jgi:hypothetical protein
VFRSLLFNALPALAIGVLHQDPHPRANGKAEVFV